MTSMFGRGFDSRQLHDQASAAASVRKRFLFYPEALRACAQKRKDKIKEPFAFRQMAVLICRTEAQGSMSKANYPRLCEGENGRRGEEENLSRPEKV
jgi:hypothetical protein